jgi:hypothetical protein
MKPRLRTDIFLRVGKARVLGEPIVASSRGVVLIVFVSQNDRSDNKCVTSQVLCHVLGNDFDDYFDSHGTNRELRTRSEGPIRFARRCFDEDGR